MIIDEKEIKDVLWGMYLENCTQGRHHETQRATVTNLIIVVSGALITLVTIDKTIDAADLPLTVFLMALGLFGAAFSAKHYDRFQLHMERARKYRDAIDEILPTIETFPKMKTQIETVSSLPANIGLVRALKRGADEKHEKDSKVAHWLISWWRLHYLWLCFHLVMFLLGLILTIMAWKYPRHWN